VAREVYRFSVTVPAGTLLTAPQISPLGMPSRVIQRIEVDVPPGPRGNVGFQLASGGLQMVPVNKGQFLIADNARLAWDLEGQIDSGAWQLIAYNTGSFPHTLELRFMVGLTAAYSPGSSPLLIESGSLSS
jgi:hypothetical protein